MGEVGGCMTFQRMLYELFYYYDLVEAYRYSRFHIEFNGVKETKNHDFLQTYYIDDIRNKKRKYKVLLLTQDHELKQFQCDCASFKRNHTCPHVPAVLINYTDEIFSYVYVDEYKASREILKTSEKNDVNAQAKPLALAIHFDIYAHYYNYNLRFGSDRLYSINNKQKLEALSNAFYMNTPYSFAKNFQYDPKDYYFPENVSRVLDFLLSSYSPNYAYNSVTTLGKREFKSLVSLLKDIPFTVNNHKINHIIIDLPTSPRLLKQGDDYVLEFEDFKNYEFLGNEFDLLLYKDTLCFLSNSYAQLFKHLSKLKISQLKFKKDDLERFRKGLLKDLQKNIQIDEGIQEIVLPKNFKPLLYFDMEKDQLVGDLRLKYDQNPEFNYFESSQVIVRDEQEEKKVVQTLLKHQFKIQNDRFIMDKLDDIAEFIEHGLDELREKYTIFCTKKVTAIDLIKHPTPVSQFSIGRTGILTYDFHVDQVDKKELDKLLPNIKLKKRYYRLKNGNIINLQTEEMQQFEQMIDSLDIDHKSLTSGQAKIPKYQALYIDSMRGQNDQIEVDANFEKFIQNYKNYHNVDITFDKKDEKLLRDYQKEGVRWLYTLYKCDLGGILADEMGLGKSFQTICFIKQILKEKKDAKILIVCPTSLVYNWKKEFDKFAPELKYVVVVEGKQKRREILKQMDQYNIFITTYGLIRNDNDVYEKEHFELCVIDEAQAIKNYQSKMTREVKKIDADIKIALTGTPVENSILELWSIFDFIMPGYLNGLSKFKEKYHISDVDEEHLAVLDTLNKKIKPFILRRKKEEVVKDLPPKIENNIYLDLPPLQQALYVKELTETKEEYEQLLAQEGVYKANFKLLQLLMRLRQICIAPSILYSHYDGESIKIEKAVEVIQEQIANGHKIVIFSSFKRVIDLLEKELRYEHITSHKIVGGVSAKERMRMVEAFDKDDTNCFLITLKAGGTGLNLTAADVVIHLDVWWNPQVENQATDRTHRIGQTKPVTVIRFITRGTIEERIIELQNKKKILSEHLIEGHQEATTLTSLTEEEMRNLLQYDKE